MIEALSPNVSLILPVHCGGAPFRACLTALHRHGGGLHEVILIADGAHDEDIANAREFGHEPLRTDHARGPARARNLGARHAQGEYLFFIDADVELLPETLPRLRACLGAAPEAAVIGSYDDAPGDPGLLSQYRNLLHHFTHQTGGEEAFTFWGACGAIRRDTFHALGGFDEGYERPSIEDIELGYRLRRGGGRIRLCKALQVKHLKRWTAWGMIRTDLFCRAIPWTRLLLATADPARDLNLGTASRFSVVAAGLLAISLGIWPSIGGVAPPLAAAAAGLTLLGLNASFYRFLVERRGAWFLLRALPWHLLFYLYGGLGYALAWVQHRAARPRADRP